MGLLIYALGIIIVACILIPLLGKLLESNSIDQFGNDSGITPTTDMEYTTLTIMELLEKNQENNDDFEQYLKDLKKKGIVNQKIDIKFYNSLALAYRNGILTRDYIKNKLQPI
jgi:hypothetical protein